MIKTVDTFLEPSELKTAINIISNLKWEYNGESMSGSDYVLWYSNLLPISFFSEYIFKKIKLKFNDKLELLHVYANGQTYGQDGSFHVDHVESDYYTFILYLSDIGPETVNHIGGYTEFKFKNGVHAIEPILNRGVFFNSNIIHRGLSPSRNSSMLRVSVAFKMRLKPYD